MRVSPLILSVGVLVTATAVHAAPAPAKPAGVEADVRCLLSMVAFTNVSKDHPQAGQLGVYYFAGRISARAPTLDLAAAVKAQAPTMEPQQLQAEIQRCGSLVSAATQKFQSAINGLRTPGVPAGPAPAGPAPTVTPAAPAPAPAATPSILTPPPPK